MKVLFLAGTYFFASRAKGLLREGEGKKIVREKRGAQRKARRRGEDLILAGAIVT